MDKNQVLFRRMTRSEELAYMGCEDAPLIAILEDVRLDGWRYDMDIVIDLFSPEEGVQVERLGIYAASLNDPIRSWMFLYTGAPLGRLQIKRLVREIFSQEILTSESITSRGFTREEI